ncbi:Gfo/Idh/MocA family protein [Atlantibacter subterraneus]|uniref:Gfo/Idh/MocA family protein n=1 Tax=Atlantibacter subterraneus TaxID=255519 RepID=UPI0029648A57|nr:Gfo/Idh/MocA family oxidoreductase [Atlantibacter subterranea]MDW2743431.1 Gfo/Idh/MocA family oxidoreductase [Atlantibacter subterranea]
MMTINSAIIGCGAIHHRHAAAIHALPETTLRAVVDTDPARGRQWASQYGCHGYQDYREMLRDPAIDVVHICTPHYLHKSMIIAALKAGKHVFCEKPIALNTHEAAEIAQAAASARGRLAVCYQNRYNPTSQAMAESLRHSSCGKMLSIKAALTWSRSETYYTASGWRGIFSTEGGSLLINQAIHTLDLIQWLAGGVVRVKGVTDSSWLATAIETEDSAMAMLELANGARGLFYATNCHTTDSPLALEIHCERGRLQLRDNTLWRITDKGREQLASDSVPENAKSYWGSSHQLAISDFYQAIQRSGTVQYCNVKQACQSLQLVEAIYRSSQLRQWITVSG